jgi:hypothetical protein
LIDEIHELNRKVQQRFDISLNPVDCFNKLTLMMVLFAGKSCSPRKHGTVQKA